MKFTEKVFIVFGLIGISMRLLNINGGSLFVVLSLLCLACLYLFCGFIFYNGIQLRKAFSKASYAGVRAWSITIAVFTGLIHFILLAAIIFRIQNWFGNAVLLLGALALTLIHTFIIYAVCFKKSIFLYRSIVVRSVVMLALGLLLLLAPSIRFESKQLPDYQQKKML